MKQVSFSDITKHARKALPVGVIALGAVAVGLSQGSASQSRAALTEIVSTGASEQATESPAPTSTPTVIVDGKQVPVDENGNASVETNDGKGHVNVSNGRTEVSTTEHHSSNDGTAAKGGNVNVNLNSQSTGGTTWSNTNVYGYSNSFNNGSQSYSSTSVFSTGSDNVSVSQN